MESILNPLGSLSTYVILAISLAELIGLSFALFHLLRTPAAAFPAASKQSKQFWGGNGYFARTALVIDDH